MIKGDHNYNPREWFRKGADVRCFPLSSILQAVGIQHVDFFSLDVEGAELQILKTLPFDSTLDIDVSSKNFLFCLILFTITIFFTFIIVNFFCTFRCFLSSTLMYPKDFQPS